MKLLYITNGITGSGGLERVLSVKASKLAEDFGYEVHIAVLNEDPEKTAFFDFSPKIKRHRLKVSGNPLEYVKQYRSGIQRIVNEIQPDIISVCDDGLKGFFIPKILNRSTKIIYERHVSKLITTAGKTGLKKWITETQFTVMESLARDFDAFVVLTEGNKNEWRHLRNLVVIPNPLPFYPVESSSLENKKVIGVGKYSHQKGLDLLLESWAKLPQDLNDWELHLYGKQDQLIQLEEQAKNSNILERIFFHPPDKEIEKRFLESSVFVLSSRYEGFGMVIIEAMACGVPAVSFDCNYGPSDIITEGKDGFLVQNGNTGQLAEKLAAVMRNENMRKEMGRTAKENVKAYLPENIVKQWDELFKKLTETNEV